MESLIKPARRIKPVETCFEMCSCGGNHGCIYYLGGKTGMISSKKQAIACLKELETNGLITLSEKEKIEEEIKKSSLRE